MGMTGKCLRCSATEFAEMNVDSELFGVLRFSRRSDSVDLDKAWHGIHYLLTGSSEPGSYPLDFLLEGGVDVGPSEQGFGAPRAFSPEEVKIIWDAMEPLTTEILKGQFSADVLIENRVYPETSWDTSSDADFTDYLEPNYTELRSHIMRAVAEREAIVVYLT